MSTFRRFFDWVLAWWPAWALGTCAGMLAIAHAFETFGHLPPCALCLTQREVYWVAGGVAAALVALGRDRLTSLRKPGLWLLALLFAIGFGVAVYHAGLEWKWWTRGACGNRGFLGELLNIPRPGMNAADMLRMLEGGPVKAVQCEEALWRFPSAPWGLSMAGWNAIISLKLVIYSVLAARRAGQ